ncbi:MAG: TonB-dependent receptor [Leptospiraceae bacterium]|nr:TonB-dependent receptor [Leptospiraceae bacterium]
MNSFAKGNKDKNSSEKQEEGSPEEEVRKIQNRISYPPEALEQGLESDCEWMVKVNDRRMVGELKNLRPCRYKVFEQTFLSVIYTWKFNLPSGTILKIPISFEIEER